MSLSLAEQKKQQRKAALARRDAMSPELRRERSQKLCRNILESEFYKNAERIMLFKAFKSEPSLEYFENAAHSDGKILLYPYCIEKGKMLALQPLENAWETDKYGISVPVRGKSQEASAADIDLVICPCSAFDSEGNRLGMGAGYYDRFLPDCKKARFLLAAFEQQRTERVISDEHDIKMHAVATDKQLYYII